ncbi:nuclease-related domain-containing protein [Alkalihalobacterium sp. APHAB7]|uniref:nuclease-related domain-containing protein n=1 Tax=Alkalihalobacterium sp. APHAB7 TaxID=3402081 RepID=UPI003AAA7C54
MIKKEHKIPKNIQKLEALLRRLAADHPKRPQIEKVLAKATAGFKGEKSIDYYLSFLPEDQFHFLHGLRLLSSGTRYFQMDTLILSPRFILILEVKNITGSLFFDKTHQQLIRKVKDREEAFPDPLLQVQRQKLQLENWLKKHKYPDSIPVRTLVVISNPSTIIKEAPNQEVLHAQGLPDKIHQIDQSFTTDVLTFKEMKKMETTLIKKHVPLEKDILSQFSIMREDIKKGVHCPECFHIPMIRKRGKWHCKKCLNENQEAHIATLKDYCLLIHKTLTNKEAREFLNIQSDSIAKHLIYSLKLKSTGKNKGRQYILEFPEE